MPNLENLTQQKKSICLQIDEVRARREKKLREDSLDAGSKVAQQGEALPFMRLSSSSIHS